MLNDTQQGEPHAAEKLLRLVDDELRNLATQPLAAPAGHQRMRIGDTRTVCREVIRFLGRAKGELRSYVDLPRVWDSAGAVDWRLGQSDHNYVVNTPPKKTLKAARCRRERIGVIQAGGKTLRITLPRPIG